MNSSLLRHPQPKICQLCASISRNPIPHLRAISLTTVAPRIQTPWTTRRNFISSPCVRRKASKKSSKPPPKAFHAPAVPADAVPVFEPDLQVAMTKCTDILHNDSSIPSEEAVLEALTACESLARNFVGAPARSPADNTTTATSTSTPASALLSLDSDTQSASPSALRAMDTISTLIYRVLVHPNVFITPALLKTYTTTQTLLRRPETFPEIFTLYAVKPIPNPSSNPITYTTPNPKRAQFAIPADLANAALQVAIDKKALPLALAIIESTFCTPAYHRAKFLRKALPPLTGLALAPLAAYTVASQLSHYQNTMEPATATNIAFAGILAYVGFTATIGIVAVTTANDQMDRVTWATGMPLRQRWLREDERAAADRVAQAWGFTQPWRKGEEEGQEWEELREWIGRGGMILDRTELMEGME
ncbi:MAG: hypothetical protein M1819_000052 [Sarea resinae]|nr:MAG: hypothetical protein M1819_000052 [Sarea resinae]